MGSPPSTGPGDAVREFHIEDESSSGDSSVLAVYGEADQYVAGELRDRLAAAIDDGKPTVVLDLSGTTFIDSMALGVLLGARNRAQAAGREVSLVVPRNELRRVFEITLLDRVFPLNETREEALATALGSGDGESG